MPLVVDVPIPCPIFTRRCRAVDPENPPVEIPLANQPVYCSVQTGIWIVETTDPANLKASMLQSINTFLRLNDVSTATIPDEDGDARETRELAAQVKEAMGDDMTPEERRAWNEGRGGALENEFGGKSARQSEPFDDR